MPRTCVILSLLLGSAVAQQVSTFGEAFSSDREGEGIEAGYRLHTTTSLLRFIGRGVLIDRLEVSPSEIRIGVGDRLDLGLIQALAFNRRGRIIEDVPLKLDLEASEDLLDFEAFVVDGTTITARRPGSAKIWVESLPPSAKGEVIRRSIDLLIE